MIGVLIRRELPIVDRPMQIAQNERPHREGGDQSCGEQPAIVALDKCLNTISQHARWSLNGRGRATFSDESSRSRNRLVALVARGNARM